MEAVGPRWSQKDKVRSEVGSGVRLKDCQAGRQASNFLLSCGQLPPSPSSSVSSSGEWAESQPLSQLVLPGGANGILEGKTCCGWYPSIAS